MPSFYASLAKRRGPSSPLSKAWRQFSSILATSSGAVACSAYRQQHDSLGKSAMRHISTARFVSPLQLSSVWKSYWACASSTKSFGTASQSRKQDSRVVDQIEEEDEEEEEEEEEEEDDDDDDDDDASEAEGNSNDEEDEDEEYEETRPQVPWKKKFQSNQLKVKAPEPQGRLRNEKITAHTIRLVDGEAHWIVSRAEAMALAKKRNLDLVLVDGASSPPVCKIFDFNKEEYRQEKLQKERKKEKGDMIRLSEVKELRFNPKTESKDLKMKADKAREFMDRGHRVKLVVNFKGIKANTEEEEQKIRVEQGKLIDVIIPMVEDIAIVEQGPRIESTRAWVLLRPSKFGRQAKKKPPKTVAQPDATSEVKTVQHKTKVTEIGESEVQETLSRMESFEGSSSQVGSSQMQTSTLWSRHVGGQMRSPQKTTINSPMQPQPCDPLSTLPLALHIFARTLGFPGRFQAAAVAPAKVSKSASASLGSQGTGIGYSQFAGPPPSSDLLKILTSQELSAWFLQAAASSSWNYKYECLGKSRAAS